MYDLLACLGLLLFRADLKALNDDDYAVREQAELRLENADLWALPALQAASEGKGEPEVVQRCRRAQERILTPWRALCWDWQAYDLITGPQPRVMHEWDGERWSDIVHDDYTYLNPVGEQAVTAGGWPLWKAIGRVGRRMKLNPDGPDRPGFALPCEAEELHGDLPIEMAGAVNCLRRCWREGKYEH